MLTFRHRLRIGAPLAAVLTRVGFEDEAEEDMWVSHVLGQYDPAGAILRRFGDDRRGAAEFPVVEWQRSVVSQGVERVLVRRRGDGEREIEVGSDPASG